MPPVGSTLVRYGSSSTRSIDPFGATVVTDSLGRQIGTTLRDGTRATTVFAKGAG
jgi:hypothetical protein